MGLLMMTMVCRRTLLLDDELSLLLSGVIVTGTGSMARPVVEVKTMTLAAQWCCNLKCIKRLFLVGERKFCHSDSFDNIIIAYA